MTTPTLEELRQLDEQAQAFIPEAAERRPSTFLSLAPSTSESYPHATKPKLLNAAPLAAGVLTGVAEQSHTGDLAKRRTSSVGSDGSNKGACGMRILKLGPVYGGEHLGEHKTDWHDVVIE